MKDQRGSGWCLQLWRQWGEQSQWSGPYLPGPTAVQKCSVIDGQRSAQGRLVTQSGHFMSEAYEIFTRLVSEGKWNAGVVNPVEQDHQAGLWA